MKSNGSDLIVLIQNQKEDYSMNHLLPFFFLFMNKNDPKNQIDSLSIELGSLNRYSN